jgi:hypothetical protein
MLKLLRTVISRIRFPDHHGLLASEQELTQRIFVIGDSHSMEFEGIPNCILKFLGSVTMHRIGRDRLNFDDLSKFMFAPKMPCLRDDDAVVFAFGQIDVTHHIFKQIETKHRDLDEVIRSLVLSYLNAIYFALIQHPRVLKIVFSITPATDRKMNPQNPYWGTLEDRIKATRALNRLLQLSCPLFGIEFLDVHDDYADENGVLRLELSDGGGHIAASSNQVIQEKLFAVLEKHRSTCACKNL